MSRQHEPKQRKALLNAVTRNREASNSAGSVGIVGYVDPAVYRDGYRDVFRACEAFLEGRGMPVNFSNRDFRFGRRVG